MGNIFINTPRVNRVGHSTLVFDCIVLCYIDGLAQECSNSSALAMELLQSCTTPSISRFLLYITTLFSVGINGVLTVNRHYLAITLVDVCLCQKWWYHILIWAICLHQSAPAASSYWEVWRYKTQWYFRGPATHYDHDVIMGAIASRITSITIVYSTVYCDADQRKHQFKAPRHWTFVWGIHRGPVNSPHKWPVTRKMFPFDDVIMELPSFFITYQCILGNTLQTLTIFTTHLQQQRCRGLIYNMVVERCSWKRSWKTIFEYECYWYPGDHFCNWEYATIVFFFSSSSSLLAYTYIRWKTIQIGT